VFDLLGFIFLDSDPLKLAGEGISRLLKHYKPVSGCYRIQTMECGARRILLVDDDPSLLKMMSMYLGRVGFTVTVSSRTDDAWQTFEASPDDYAVAVLDGSMPGLGMEELARRMLHTNPRMCVIAASGYPLDMTAVEAEAQGRAMFLQKPFSTAMLTEAVRRMIAAQEEEL